MIEKKKDNNKFLRKEITNATFGQLLWKLEEKCKMLNKIFIQVDTYYASINIGYEGIYRYFKNKYKQI